MVMEEMGGGGRGRQELDEEEGKEGGVLLVTWR